MATALLELGDRYWALGLPSAARSALLRAHAQSDGADAALRLTDIALAQGDAGGARRLRQRGRQARARARDEDPARPRPARGRRVDRRADVAGGRARCAADHRMGAGAGPPRARPRGRRPGRPHGRRGAGRGGVRGRAHRRVARGDPRCADPARGDQRGRRGARPRRGCCGEPRGGQGHGRAPDVLRRAARRAVRGRRGRGHGGRDRGGAGGDRGGARGPARRAARRSGCAASSAGRARTAPPIRSRCSASSMRWSRPPPPSRCPPSIARGCGSSTARCAPMTWRPAIAPRPPTARASRSSPGTPPRRAGSRC